MDGWLRTHPDAWHGWPSHALFDRQEAQALAARLNQCGTHVAITPDMLPLIGELIQQIRAERRKVYRAWAVTGAW